jgi:GNAT superfamily N-acetyltransferase
VQIRLATRDDFDALVDIDDDATRLFPAHIDASCPFAVDEQARWARAIVAGRAFVAVEEGRAIGFAALDLVDAQPYLDQLSVRMSAMRRGVGRALLDRAITWAEGRPLWLTTYDHLAWNRPYYERAGFVVVADAQCGPGILHHLGEQRRWLPAPEHRVAMVKLVTESMPRRR